MQVLCGSQVAFEDFFETLNCCLFLFDALTPPLQLCLSPVLEKHARFLHVLQQLQLQFQQVVFDWLGSLLALLVLLRDLAVNVLYFGYNSFLEVTELVFELHSPFSVFAVLVFVTLGYLLKGLHRIRFQIILLRTHPTDSGILTEEKLLRAVDYSIGPLMPILRSHIGIPGQVVIFCQLPAFLKERSVGLGNGTKVAGCFGEVLGSALHSSEDAFSDIVENRRVSHIVLVSVVHVPSEITNVDFLSFVVGRRYHLVELVSSQK